MGDYHVRFRGGLEVKLLWSTRPELNPIIRGWGNYYRKAHVRRLFLRLKGWIVQRIWSHSHKRWRNSGWKVLPEPKLYEELGLVNLVSLIPSIASAKAAIVKAGCGKTARPV
jgi:hypothetical protein